MPIGGGGGPLGSVIRGLMPNAGGGSIGGASCEEGEGTAEGEVIGDGGR